MKPQHLIATLADDREVKIEIADDETRPGPGNIVISIDDGARCYRTRSSREGDFLAYASSRIFEHRESYVVEWRRAGETSRAELRAALLTAKQEIEKHIPMYCAWHGYQRHRDKEIEPCLNMYMQTGGTLEWSFCDQHAAEAGGGGTDAPHAAALRVIQRALKSNIELEDLL